MYEKTLSLTRLLSFKKQRLHCFYNWTPLLEDFFAQGGPHEGLFLQNIPKNPFLQNFGASKFLKCEKRMMTWGMKTFIVLNLFLKEVQKNFCLHSFEKKKRCLNLLEVRQSSFKNSHFEIFNFAPSSWLCASFSPTCIFPIWPLCNNLQ